MQQLGSPANSNRDQAASESSKRQRPRELPASCCSERRGGGSGGLGFGPAISLSSPLGFLHRTDQNTPTPPRDRHCALRFAPVASSDLVSPAGGLAGERLSEMPPAAATLLRWAPAAPFAARLAAVSRPGMARRLVTASTGAGGRAPAYGGLLLDAGGTLLQVARPVAETYASIGQRYGPYSSNPKNPPPRTLLPFDALSCLLCISSNVWRVVSWCFVPDFWLLSRCDED